MLKGLPLFSLTINCSDRKFEFQIIEYIPCTEISSIHAQVVLVIKVPATLPSWMKREEFIKMVSYRGVVWVIADSCLVVHWGQNYRISMEIQQKEFRLVTGGLVRHRFTTKLHCDPFLLKILKEATCFILRQFRAKQADVKMNS